MVSDIKFHGNKGIEKVVERMGNANVGRQGNTY